MKSQIAATLICAVFICTFSAVISQTVKIGNVTITDYSHRSGSDEAEADIKKGDIHYMLYGDPTDYLSYFIDILKSRYGVTCQRIAGCVVDQPLQDFAESYNSKIEAHLKKIYGEDVVKESFDEAQKKKG